MGSTKTSTRVEVPPPTAQEIALQEQQIKLAEAQLQAITEQTAFQKEQFALAGPLFEKQIELLTKQLEPPTAEEQAQADKYQAIYDELLERQLDEIRRGGAASPEQIRLIEQATASALAKGESDISAYSEDALRQVRESLAPALGLRPSDSPIIDRGQLVAKEGVRQQGQLARELAGARANAQLNFPLASSQVIGAQSNFNQNLLQAAAQFKEGLKEAAQFNRLQLAGSTVGNAGNLGLGLATGIPANVTQGIASLQQLRLGSASQFGTYREPLINSRNFGAIVQGAGSAIAGIAASSKKLKTDKRKIDESKVLDLVKDLDVEEWRYIGDEQRHVGPYAEDFRETFGVGDGGTIHLADVAGVTIAAIKALDKKIDGLGLAKASKAKKQRRSLDLAKAA